MFLRVLVTRNKAVNKSKVFDLDCILGVRYLKKGIIIYSVIIKKDGKCALNDVLVVVL